MTSRRGFLGLLGAVAAAAKLDPERALWVPGAKTISIPAPRNVLVVPPALSWLTLVSLQRHLEIQRELNGIYTAQMEGVAVMARYIPRVPQRFAA